MSTIDVLNAEGAIVPVELPLVPGRAAATASRPVALSNEDKAALDLLHTDLSAAATAANQTSANTKLDTLHTDLAGIATAANQTAANTKLDTLHTDLSVVGRVVAASSRPVVLSTEDKAALDLLHTDLSSGTFGVAQNSTTAGETGPLVQGAVTTAAPTYTTAKTAPLSLDTAGNLRVNVAAGGAAGGTSSALGSAVPATATAAGFSDGTNMVLAKVRAASSGPAAVTDPALVVTIRDVNGNGRAAAASSAPVVLSTEDNALVARLLPTATASGVTPSRINAAASTNATSLKASAGQIYTIDVFNPAAYNVFLKFYNKASAPTVGTDTPVLTIPVQAGGGFSKTWPSGLPFSTGIAYAITKLQADTDTTVVVAGDLTGNTTWI